MTLERWVDYSDRKIVQEAFDSKLREVLYIQGVDDSEKFLFAIELSKAVGVLEYYFVMIRIKTLIIVSSDQAAKDLMDKN